MNFGDGRDGDGDDDGLFFRRKGGYDLNSKIMLTAIISLSVVVLVVLVLHVYTRFVLRRQLRRRLELRQLDLLAIASAGGDGSDEAPPKSAGLDPSVIAALPVFTFGKLKEVAAGGGGGAAAECAVCLSVMEEEEKAMLLPNCNHAFHVGCIDAWLRSNNSTCPICRTHADPMKRPVDPAVLPLDRVNSELSYAGATSTDGTVQSSSSRSRSSSSSILNDKEGGPSSSSRMLSWEKPLIRTQTPGGGVQEDGTEDLERR